MSDESASHVGDLVSVSIVTHQLNILLIVAPLGAMLVPFVCTLFAFTPREIRRKPVFIVNIAACVLGIIQATAIVALNYQILAFPNDPMPISMYLSKIGILLLPPIFIDAVIIFRFLAFFPIQLTPRRTLLAVLAFPVICKIARLALVCGFMGTYPLENLSGPRSVTIQGFLWSRGPALSVIFGLQSVDNTYASSIFLYKLYQFRKNGVNILHNEVLMRITSIFLIGLGNYIFPVTVNIVQTVLTFTSPGLTSGIYIIFTNNFLSILSGVFATLWICKQNWARRIVDTSTPPAASINYRDNKAVYDGGDDDDEGLGVYP